MTMVITVAITVAMVVVAMVTLLVLTEVRLTKWWKHLGKNKKHSSTFFHWDCVERGYFVTLDGSVALRRMKKQSGRPRGWYLILDLGTGKSFLLAGHSRSDAFAYADKWCSQRMDDFLANPPRLKE